MNNRTQIHARAFPVRTLTPTKAWCVGRKALLSLFGKGACSDSAHFEWRCGWDEIRTTARLPCDSDEELPSMCGEFSANS